MGNLIKLKQIEEAELTSFTTSIVDSLTEEFLTTGEAFSTYYPRTNPSGYVRNTETGVFVTRGETGAFITSGQTGIFVTSVLFRQPTPSM